MFFLKHKYILLIITLFNCLLFSCSQNYIKNSSEDSASNSQNIESIYINNLMMSLLESDKKLTPKLINNNNGSSFYTYKKRPGEGEISLGEIKERIALGSDFYKNDREKISILLKAINALQINNKLDNLNNDILGLWIPSKDLIVIDYRVVDMGSPTFLDVLRHEVIHVAQSCFNGSRGTFPSRIGLPLEFSQEINLNLSHKAYSNNPEEVINIEREAFTYSKVDGAAIKLLNKFC